MRLYRQRRVHPVLRSEPLRLSGPGLYLFRVLVVLRLVVGCVDGWRRVECNTIILERSAIVCLTRWFVSYQFMSRGKGGSDRVCNWAPEEPVCVMNDMKCE